MRSPSQPSWRTGARRFAERVRRVRCCRRPPRAILALAVLAAATVSAAPVRGLDDDWREPPADARLRAYWWWLNGHVDAAAITRDLEQMKAKGFGGAVIFDAGGAQQDGNRPVPAGPRFGSPAWRELLRHTLEEGDRLGLEMSLNIQSGWNLGGPGVSDDDAVKKLVYSEAVVSGPAAAELALAEPPRVDGYYRDIAVLAFPLRHPPSGGVADWRQKTLEAKLAFTGPNAFFLTNSAPRTDVLVRSEADVAGEEDAAADDVLDLTTRMDAQGRLRWSPPPGAWQVLRFGCTLGDVHRVSTHSDGWDGNALDVFDRGAFWRYADAVVVPILEEMRRYHSLRYLHTDSWEVDLINWTPTLRAEFQRRRGYDPLPYLPAFAGRIVGSRTTTDRFLNDYRRTLGDLAIDNHYRPMRELAARFGLGLHPESGGPHYTPIDAQQCLGFDDVPMSEFWAQSATHRTTEASRFFVKQPASAAHTYGRPFVSAEGFTSIGPHWQETLWDDLKPSFDHALAEGLNRLVWHAFVCSPASMGVPGQQYFAGTHFNPNVTWWEYSGPFLAYLNRCQAMLQRGLPVADVLYYYGDHVPNFTQLRASDPAKAGPGYDYDVITADALLQRVSVRDGRLVLPEGTSYRLLVLPPEQTIAPAVLEKVRDLVHAGATVIGPRPTASNSLANQPAADEMVRRIAGELWPAGAPSAAARTASGRVRGDESAQAALAAAGVAADVTFAPDAGRQFDWVHRRDGAAEIYFVANRQHAAAKVDVSFRVTQLAPELWDPVTGERRVASAYRSEGGRTVVPLELPPCGSTFVVFRSPAESRPARARSNADRFAVVTTLAGAWDVHFDPTWGGPAHVVFDALVSWTDRAEPGIRFYSGTATYAKTFVAPATEPGASVWLDLGTVREIAAVRLNGISLGIVWAPPFRVALTPALRDGTNRLEIAVVNQWANRIVGDAALPPAERLTRTNITRLTARTPLMPSGLLGPVTLQLRRPPE